MEITKTIYLSDRKFWHEWLAKNYLIEKDIWLIYPNKATNKDRLSYNDAVEEALSFGWIDSIQKRFDEGSTVQRFSPRNYKSSYSQANIERLRYLADNHLLQPEIEVSVRGIIEKPFIFPVDILSAIRSNKMAWLNYLEFSPSYRRIRIAFIEGARNRPLEFQKRLNHFIKMTEKGKTYGFGGIEKHF